ncbi:hypothetical protein [Stenotrophomonas lactitubi]|uniref:hypothetical protein n=1 Tax=Stenotrophomonas lactitubi TaxID=2045214 RepID=UPI001D8C6D64|nr:hypothetical protein [Stenotrophomonas lactitubi]CAH0221592.1 hypothetical protein SRABI35_02232 [Stenotrophomonas lactitubi]
MNTAYRLLALGCLAPFMAQAQSVSHDRVAPAPHCLDARGVRQVEQQTPMAIAVRDGQGRAYRIDFSAACPGVNEAEELRLEAPAGWACGRPREQVMVDGRACAIGSVIPIDNREFAFTTRESSRQFAATLPGVTVTAKSHHHSNDDAQRRAFQTSSAVCFATRNVRGWSEDPQGVVVETNPRRNGGHRYYRVELASSCSILAGAYEVDFHSGFQNGLICGNPGDRIVMAPSPVAGDLRAGTPRFARPGCDVLAVYPKDAQNTASR